MKKLMLASWLAILGLTGSPGVAQTADTAVMSEAEISPNAIGRETYRSEVVRLRRGGAVTYSFAMNRPIQADEIQLQAVAGAVDVQRVVVVFNNGNSRLLNNLVGVYGRDGRGPGVRNRSATFNNVRRIQEVLVTVRGQGGRWSRDAFRLRMGLSRAGGRD